MSEANELRKAWELVQKTTRELQEKHSVEADKEFLAKVRKVWEDTTPEEYRWVKLHELVPSDKSSLALDRQQAVINLIKSAPLDGYAFFGPPSIGKTVWTAALYRHALNVYLKEGDPTPHFTRRYFPITRITAKQMLDEHTTYATTNFEDELDRRLNQPTVTPEKITHLRNVQKLTPRLFLEEIDKTKETESRRANLFAILEALHNNQGQLVVNSNLTPEEFAERMGEDLWWRIKKMSKIVSLF